MGAKGQQCVLIYLCMCYEETSIIRIYMNLQCHESICNVASAKHCIQFCGPVIINEQLSSKKEHAHSPAPPEDLWMFFTPWLLESTLIILIILWMGTLLPFVLDSYENTHNLSVKLCDFSFFNLKSPIRRQKWFHGVRRLKQYGFCVNIDTLGGQ